VVLIATPPRQFARFGRISVSGGESRCASVVSFWFHLIYCHRACSDLILRETADCSGVGENLLMGIYLSGHDPIFFGMLNLTCRNGEGKSEVTGVGFWVRFRFVGAFRWPPHPVSFICFER